LNGNTNPLIFNLPAQAGTNQHQSMNKILFGILIIIFGILFFSPVQAEETPTTTEDNIQIPDDNNNTNTSTEDNTEPINDETTPTSTEEIPDDIETPTTTIETPTSTIDTPTSTEENSDDSNEQSNNTNTSTAQILITQSQINEAINKILSYLKSQQDETGKIIDGTITDWSIISFGANNEYADEIKSSDESQTLLDYEKKYNLDDPSDMNSCATYPRHILALLSAGVNIDDPAIQGLKDKMTTICYQNNSYGLYGINDDVFGLIALLAVNTNSDEPIIQDIISTIEDWQLSNGAFSWPDWFDPTQKTAGDDITGASINALKYAQTSGADIDEQIFTNAKNYLKTTQQTDGGWGYGSSDIMTTSWVLMGINSLNESQNEWFSKAGTNPWYPLINQLNDDGFYESAWVPGTVDWFAMKHIVPALAGKSWPIILPAKIENFSENATFTYGRHSHSEILPETPTTTPTSTLDIVTTTLDISTTTLDINTTTLDVATTTLELTTTTENITTTTEKDNDIVDKTEIGQKLNLPAQAGRNLTNNKTTTQNKYQNLEPVNYNLTSTPITTNDTISPSTATTSIPYPNTAKGVFATATAMASGLGLYLGWKFLQTLL